MFEKIVAGLIGTVFMGFGMGFFLIGVHILWTCLTEK